MSRTPSPRRIDGAQVELLFKDPEGYKLARDEYNKKMKEEIMEEGAPDRAFLLQAAAVGLGSFLFGFLAGFPTALTLLDIPFSRRQWSTAQRISFIRKNFLPVIAFGAVSGLLFVIPLIGPLVMVPSASVGGLWLICRLDKTPMRPEASPSTTS